MTVNAELENKSRFEVYFNWILVELQTFKLDKVQL